MTPVTKASIQAAVNATASLGQRVAIVAQQARMDMPAGDLIAAISVPIVQRDSSAWPGFRVTGVPARLPIQSTRVPRQIHSQAARVARVSMRQAAASAGWLSRVLGWRAVAVRVAACASAGC